MTKAIQNRQIIRLVRRILQILTTTMNKPDQTEENGGLAAAVETHRLRRQQLGWKSSRDNESESIKWQPRIILAAFLIKFHPSVVLNGDSPIDKHVLDCSSTLILT